MTQTFTIQKKGRGHPVRAHQRN